MNQNILYISFLLGIREKEFQLPLKSYKKLEAAGLVIGNVYEVDIFSDLFLEFYRYVRDKYGVLKENRDCLAPKRLVPSRAIIEQKKEIQGQPWKHLLIASEGFRVEKILFYPDTCGLENEEEDKEYQEDLKRAEVIKSLVTTLPEAYRDSYVKE